MPLYKLFGGKNQDSVPLYYCSWHDTPENQRVCFIYITNPVNTVHRKTRWLAPKNQYYGHVNKNFVEDTEQTPLLGKMMSR